MSFIEGIRQMKQEAPGVRIDRAKAYCDLRQAFLDRFKTDPSPINLIREGLNPLESVSRVRLIGKTGYGQKAERKTLNISSSVFFGKAADVEYALLYKTAYRRILPKGREEQKEEIKWQVVKVEEANLLTDLLNNPDDEYAGFILSSFWGGIEPGTVFDFIYEEKHR